MKIAISAQGNQKDSLTDSRFGRCKYFCIYDTDNNDFKAIVNIAEEKASGAGIQAANLVLKENIDVLITGNIGPYAYDVLTRSNINIFTIKTMTVSDAIDAYKENKLTEYNN